jgi:hypothetical protein
MFLFLLGVPVIFELVGGINPESSGNSGDAEDLPKEGSLLTCCFSRLSSNGELLILSKYEMQNHDNTGMLLLFLFFSLLNAAFRFHRLLDDFQSFSFIWEICPEQWINDDLEFLDRYLT